MPVRSSSVAEQKMSESNEPILLMLAMVLVRSLQKSFALCRSSRLFGPKKFNVQCLNCSFVSLPVRMMSGILVGVCGVVQWLELDSCCPATVTVGDATL